MRTPRLPVVRLNWRPRRFKYTRPFRRKTKYGFCACAVTFQMQSTSALDGRAQAAGKRIFQMSNRNWSALRKFWYIQRNKMELNHWLWIFKCLIAFRGDLCDNSSRTPKNPGYATVPEYQISLLASGLWRWRVMLPLLTNLLLKFLTNTALNVDCCLGM